MKLYTATGDDGETSLFDGTRVGKDDPRVAAYGDIDELNAALGWCRAGCGNQPLSSRLQQIQNELFVIGAELATPPDSSAAGRVPHVGDDAARRLEGWIDEAAAATPPLKNFVLPGGVESACRLHLARTCCRRAERSVVSLGRSEPVRREVVVYLNRLGDLLFAWARLANHEAQTPDIPWVPSK